MKTKVIIRRFHGTGDLIAYFPEEPADQNYGHCMTYQHVGQHSAGSVDFTGITAPVVWVDPDVVALVKELEDIGYSLIICRRVAHSMDLVRRSRMDPEVAGRMVTCPNTAPTQQDRPSTEISFKPHGRQDKP